MNRRKKEKKIMKIRTNELNCSLNYSAIMDRFDIFCVYSSKDESEKPNLYRSYLLDIPLLNKSIYSLSHTRYSEFFVAMPKNPKNKGALDKAMQGDQDNKRMKTVQVNADGTYYKDHEVHKIKDYVLIRLLLNGLCHIDPEDLQCSNLTGQFYWFNKGWIKDKKAKGLQFEITQNLTLKLNVKTFTSLSEKVKTILKKNGKKPSDYACFVWEKSSNRLRRKLEDEKQKEEKTYIMRSMGNSRNTVPFLNISERGYGGCKIRAASDVFWRFNEIYEGLAHLDFKSYEENSPYLTISKKDKDLFKKKAIELFQDSNVRIVFDDSDEDLKWFAQGIQKQLIKNFQKEDGSFKLTMGKDVDPDALNLYLIHDREYYKQHSVKEEDPYRIFDGISVQHVTLENSQSSILKKQDKVSTALMNVINQLLIKEDLAKKKITLTDWAALGYQTDVTFGKPILQSVPNQRYQQIIAFSFMTIHPDGTFGFYDETFDEFKKSTSQTPYRKCIEAMDPWVENPKDIRTIQIGDAVNTIRDTDLFTMPDVFELHEKQKEPWKKQHLRSEDHKWKIFGPCLDIKSYNKDDAIYYYSGVLSESMVATLANAVRIRQVKAVGNSPLIFDQIKPLLNAYFVRFGQLTVWPYPFKYLDEHIRQSNLGKTSDEK